MTEHVVIRQADNATGLTVGELRAFVALLDGVPDDVTVRARTRIKGQNADGLLVRHVSARWTS